MNLIWRSLSEQDKELIKENLSNTHRLISACSWTYDLKTQEIFYTKELLNLLEMSLDEFAMGSKNLYQKVKLEDREIVSRAHQEMLKGKEHDIKFRIKTSNNNEKYIKERVKVILDCEGRPKKIIGVLQDITDYEEQLNNSNLAKLPNSTSFKNDLEKYLSKAKELNETVAIAMVKIDSLDNINVALGYRIGDKIIEEAGLRLKRLLKHNVYHYVGPQFSVILTGNKTIKQYEEKVKEIVNLFETSFFVDEYPIELTISIGVSVFPYNGSDTETLINNAQIALVQAKEKASNNYVFYNYDMSMSNMKQFVIRNELRKALDEKQFEVYYQPMVNLKTTELIAAEALVRWNHPRWGLVYPGDFISIAEETGYIIGIENIILDRICSDMRKWQDLGLPSIKISMNFSSVHFNQEDLHEHVLRTINKYGLDPHFLIIEITESILLDKSIDVMMNIKKLRENRIQIALDDFGTGYSCLQYLMDFRIDILKIESSFVKNALQDKTSDIITTHVIKMAQDLKVKLVAEGIETFEQLKYLQNLDCHTGQGYLFSKPIPRKEFEEKFLSYI